MMGTELDAQDRLCILSRDRSLAQRGEYYRYGLPADDAAAPVACINKRALRILPF